MAVEVVRTSQALGALGMEWVEADDAVSIEPKITENVYLVIPDRPPQRRDVPVLQAAIDRAMQSKFTNKGFVSALEHDLGVANAAPVFAVLKQH
jgi:hypothetical protein